jgi:phage shock protein PspC (stress-responsive transcriptional regulator)
VAGWAITFRSIRIVRIIFIALVFAGLGGVVVYFILWIVTPEEPLPGDTTIDVDSQEDK